ncbi:ribonucleotide-diphosphate reductase subunit alpha [compost metagenome]
MISGVGRDYDHDPAPIAATLAVESAGDQGTGNDGHSHGVTVTSRDLCPSCGTASLINIEGCKTCSTCGYSKCS